MSQNVRGTFVSPRSIQVGQISDTLVMPSGSANLKLTLAGLDANNTVKTQKTVNNGHTWVDQVTYNANQAAVNVAAVHGEQWRLVVVTQELAKSIAYEMSAQS